MKAAKPTIKTGSPTKFLTEVRSELRKVTWPTREETIKLTSVVIAISLIVAFFIGGLDLLMIKLTSALY